MNENQFHKKKILLINNCLSGGGSERVMVLLANELCSMGHIVEMFIIKPQVEEVYELKSEIRRIKFGYWKAKGIGYYVRLIKSIRNVMKNGKYEGVISFLVTYNVVTLLAGFGLKQKIIVSERCDPTVLRNKGFIFRILETVLYPHAKNVVFQTDYVKSLFSRKIQNKGVVIPNPVNPDIPEPCKWNERKKIIISAGRLSKQKNYPMLVDAFEIFNKSNSDYKLVIYGKGELEHELKGYIHEKGLDEQIIIAGYVSDVDERIREASLFILASNYEGISNAMIEALAMGVPTICTDCPVGGARLMIEQDVNGILVAVGDTEQLYKSMKRVLTNEVLSIKLGENAQKIKLKYNINTIAAMWVKLLD